MRMQIMNEKLSATSSRSWRAIAEQDRANKTREVDEQALSNTQAHLKKIRDAVDKEGWRGARIESDHLPHDHITWREFKLTDEEVLQREEERREKMAEKAKRRADKVEKAKQAWAKSKGQRDKRAGKRGKKPYRSHYKGTTRGSTPDTNEQIERAHHHRYNQTTIELSDLIDGPRHDLDQPPIPSDLKSPYKSTWGQASPEFIEQQEGFLTTTAESSEQFKKTSPHHKEKKKKQRPPINAMWLKNSGLRYLGRFNASEQHFRTILAKKIREADSRVTENPQEHQKWIEEAVTYAKTYGGLDDEKFAFNLARSFKRKGMAKRLAHLKMKQKKLTHHHIEAALNSAYLKENDDMIDPSLYAACRAAKKKRLGPWGPTNIDYPSYQKQLAKLARRGFTYGIAQQVLKASLEEAEEWLLQGED